MFQVVGLNITMSRGDTGSIVIRATGGHHFNQEDRALFTVKTSDGTIVKQEAHEIDGSGKFTVSFRNAETDYLSPGLYQWDVRYIINPHYDESGEIVDGDQVITPKMPQSLTILTTVGQI